VSLWGALFGDELSVYPFQEDWYRMEAYKVASEKQLATDPSRGVLNERGTTHGDFRANGAIMQKLKEAMHEEYGWTRLLPYQREALEMIQHKIGRILCGDPNYYDHWRDIAGYAKLVEERCPHPEPNK
jgi:hypothetical protein